MKITIDGNQITSKVQFHKVLKEKLELPDYYGNNLDALLDCLTGWVDLPLLIEWNNYSQSKINLGEYATKALETFEIAQKKLNDFQIKIN